MDEFAESIFGGADDLLDQVDGFGDKIIGKLDDDEGINDTDTAGQTMVHMHEAKEGEKPSLKRKKETKTSDLQP